LAGQGGFTTGPSETLGLSDGILRFDTPQIHLGLVKDSQTVSELRPNGAGSFDFTPSDRLKLRSFNGYYHLGDLTFRARVAGTDAWTDFSTATSRHPVTPLPAASGELASADLGPTLPTDCPLHVTRTWKIDAGRLELLFQVSNPGQGPVEIGALGIPMPFNNIISDRSLKQANETCSFSDPYIGQDAGYLQVTRLSGQGPALIVAPVGRTPFEAYRLLREPMPPNQTFEGTFAWMVHTQAYAEKEWKGVQEWNPPTSETLKPGQSRTYGVEFLVSPAIRSIEQTLAKAHRPVAVGIPGYVLPMDQVGKLFLKYGTRVAKLEADPPGSIQADGPGPGNNGWQELDLRGKGWGRSRLTVTYADGLKQAVSYYVTKPATQAVDDLGHFLTTKQWFDDPNDPFHRAPSAITYDREANHQVVQDSRVWIAGLSDEAGAGSWLAAGLKEFERPDPAEIAKYEQFVDGVLWGGIQFKDGPKKYGVRKSVFFYDPKVLPDYPYEKSFDWRSWTSWNKDASEDVGRGYDYPHVVAAYWSMYRVARNHPGLVRNHPWNWYLDQAYRTTMFLTGTDDQGRERVGYTDAGLMEGDIFLALLTDLKREGWKQQAADVEGRMKRRADAWTREAYPFGSEMAWDSTGQEEVYAWCKYFGYPDKALVALDSILGYMPTVPHWGYNGNARRYWDFIYGGKLERIERQIHHYGSGINSLPVLDTYRSDPADLYLLRVGYGGAMGSLSNIDQEGFASAAFHSFPSTLKWDAYSGDYGPNFFGHAFATATYVIHDADFGWQAFGGNVTLRNNDVVVEPKDDYRARAYIGPLGLWLTLDAGTIQTIVIDPRNHHVRICLAPKDAFTPSALLHVEQPAKITGIGAFRPRGSLKMERNGYVVPLGPKPTWVELVPL
jgi:hypothetical protein